MGNLKINKQYLGDFINDEVLNRKKELGIKALNSLINKDGKGNDFLGWIDLPTNYDKNEYARIKTAAKKINENSDILLVIGIGGSYLGARAVISALQGKFDNFSSQKQTQVMFAGHHMSSTFTVELLDYLKDKDFSINVISKSGTTTEPAIAFRIFNELLENKYGKEEAKKRVYATTDKSKGALKDLSDQENYETFVVPDDVGGRFSVLTAVGLLPILTAGIDTDQLLNGAKKAKDELLQLDYSNPAIEYAAIRNVLLEQDLNTEFLINYESHMYFVGEWWKQLYGESEGKENKGIMPATAIFSTDLHSMGQYIQQGRRNLFETVIKIEQPKANIKLKANEVNLDGLNYLADKDLNYINSVAMQATAKAHLNGDCPSIILELEKIDAFNLGYLLYFFEIACGISGYILGVNPFDQPGVEEYKVEMFKMLGKKGY